MAHHDANVCFCSGEGGGGASRPPEITILNTALRWAVRESESERFYSGPRSNLLNLRALRSCGPSNFRTFFLVITELLRSSKSNYRSIELSVHIRKDTSKMRHAPVVLVCKYYYKTSNDWWKM